jgi:pimeloyl-ACP methyl ester carboxylesterase
MANLPIVLIPGINGSARLYSAQIPSLWRYGPVTIADHTRGETVQDIAGRIVASAPPRFTLVGFSFGGYVAFEILRQAGRRVARLALVDTSARADTPEQSDRRRERVAMALDGRFVESLILQFPLAVHASRRGDEELRQTYITSVWPTNAERRLSSITPGLRYPAPTLAPS